MVGRSPRKRYVAGSSKLPDAKKFRRWVTSEVLPSIRRNGCYTAGQERLTDTELLAKAVLVAQKTIEERNARIRELEAQNEANAPKVSGKSQMYFINLFQSGKRQSK